MSLSTPRGSLVTTYTVTPTYRGLAPDRVIGNESIVPYSTYYGNQSIVPYSPSGNRSVLGETWESMVKPFGTGVVEIVSSPFVLLGGIGLGAYNAVGAIGTGAYDTVSGVFGIFPVMGTAATNTYDTLLTSESAPSPLAITYSSYTPSLPAETISWQQPAYNTLLTPRSAPSAPAITYSSNTPSLRYTPSFPAESVSQPQLITVI